MPAKGKESGRPYNNGGYWAVRVNAKPISLGKKTTKKAPADIVARAAELFQAGRNGELPNDGKNWTIKEASDKYIGARVGVAEKTQAAWTHDHRPLCHYLGDRKLKDLTGRDVLESYIKKRTQGETQITKGVDGVDRYLFGAGPSKINREMAYLKLLLYRANLASAGVIKLFKELRLKRIAPTRGRAWTSDEKAIIAEVASERSGESRRGWAVGWNAQMLAEGTGFRSIEIKSLRVRDLHLDELKPYIEVSRSKTQRGLGRRFYLVTGIQLSTLNAAIALYARYKRICSELGIKESPDHYLMPADLSRHTSENDPLCGRTGFDPTRHATSWRTAWQNIRKEAARRLPSFSELRFHDLRYTFITELALADVPIAVAQQSVGHMDEAMTEHYTNVQEQPIERASVAMATGKSYRTLTQQDVDEFFRKQQLATAKQLESLGITPKQNNVKEFPRPTSKARRAEA